MRNRTTEHHSSNVHQNYAGDQAHIYLSIGPRRHLPRSALLFVCRILGNETTL